MRLVNIILITIDNLKLILGAQVEHKRSTETVHVSKKETAKQKKTKDSVCNLENFNAIFIRKREVVEKIISFSKFIETRLRLIENPENIKISTQIYLSSLNEVPLQEERTRFHKYDAYLPQDKPLDLSLPKKRAKMSHDCIPLCILPKQAKYDDNTEHNTLEQKINKDLLAESFIEYIAKDVMIFFYKNKWETENIEEFMRNKKESINKEFLMDCINFIIKSNDMYLYVIIQGLNSFLIKIKDNEIKIDEDKYSVVLFYFIVLKQLSENLKITKVCGARKCSFIIRLRQSYVFILDEIHDVFVKILEFSNVNEFNGILYKYLILAKRNYKLLEMINGSKIYCRKTINLVFDPIFDIIFNLDIKIILRLLKNHRRILFCNFTINSFTPGLFFLGIFEKLISSEEIKSLIDKYERAIMEIETVRCNKSQFWKPSDDLRPKVFKIVKETYDEPSDVFIHNNGAKQSIWQRTYGIFLCSTMINLFKCSHEIHYDEKYYEEIYAMVNLQ